MVDSPHQMRATTDRISRKMYYRLDLARHSANN
jgi:hypothetical protein